MIDGVKIWNMSSLMDINENSPNNDKKIRKNLLCTITGHTGSVNVVRWSPNGRYLATASSDETVGIAENRSDIPNQSFLNSEVGENWRFRHLLRGHKLDVLDISWSPDSTKLASCGHDQQIIIWDITSEGSM